MSDRKVIKVCGMRCGDNILAVDSLGVDLMGFIFYPRSARFVDELPSKMPTAAKCVGVFVNDTIDAIRSRIESFGLDYIQLHGAESPQFCGEVASLGVKVIKAFSVDSEFDFESVKPYEPHCELFIFDTKCSGYGGSGEQFDWSLLQKYEGRAPFLLSGGVGLESLESLAQFEHPRLAGYDLNSRFEITPAVKDAEQLREFIEKIKCK